MLKSSLNSSVVRDINTSIVLSALRSRGTASKSQLARATGLSYPTVAAIVNYLMAEGFVEYHRLGMYEGGRKPMLVRFIPTARCIIGVSLSGTVPKAAAADLNGRLISPVLEGDAQQVEEDPAAAVIELIARLRQPDSGWDWPQVIGIGASLRGSFDISRGLYYFPGRSEPIRLQEQLERRFNTAVILERNANAAILAEYVEGAARDVRCAVFINVDRGVSSGLVVAGQLCRGFSGNAGEFGHLSVDPAGALCPDCGQRGCLENSVSMAALVQRAAVAGIVAQEGGTVEHFQYVAQAALDGSAAAQALFSQAAEALAQGVTGLVNVINPEQIIFGGRVVWGYPPLVDQVRQFVLQSCWPYSRPGLDLVTAAPERDSFLRGAVALVTEQVFLPHEIQLRAR